MAVMLVGVLISQGVHGIWKGSEVEKAARLLSMLLILFAALRVPRRILARALLGTLPAVWSAAAMGVLLEQGIGDTIRVSLTPSPGGDRRNEVYAACELLQALGLRAFAPSITACPGCGRTTSTTFQSLAELIQRHVREMMPVWKARYDGVEEMRVAVMGCVVNGPGESRAANIGISLPGAGEDPTCPVYVDGEHTATLRGSYDELADAFLRLVDDYIKTRYDKKSVPV